MSRIHVKKGDKVIVTSGKDKGKKGKVLKTVPSEQRIIVEGVALIKCHMKPGKKNPQGGIVQREASIVSSNVQLICPSCGMPTRTSKRSLEKDRIIRVCKKCGADIDKV